MTLFLGTFTLCSYAMQETDRQIPREEFFSKYGTLQAERYVSSLAGQSIPVALDEQASVSFLRLLSLLLEGKPGEEYQKALYCYRSYAQSIYEKLNTVDAHKIHTDYLKSIKDEQTRKVAQLNYAAFKAVFEHTKAVCTAENDQMQELLLAFVHAMQEQTHRKRQFFEYDGE